MRVLGLSKSRFSSGWTQPETHESTLDRQGSLTLLHNSKNWSLMPIILAIVIGVAVGLLSDTILKTSPFLYPLF